MVKRKSESKLMTRARRTSQVIVSGPAIFEIVTSTAGRNALVRQAATGDPPVKAISPQLAGLPGMDVQAVRQFAGLCIRAVLEEEGFEVAETGVRLPKGSLFRTASTFRKLKDGRLANRSDTIDVLIAGVGQDDAIRLINGLRRRFPNLML